MKHGHVQQGALTCTTRGISLYHTWNRLVPYVVQAHAERCVFRFFQSLGIFLAFVRPLFQLFYLHLQTNVTCFYPR